MKTQNSFLFCFFILIYFRFVTVYAQEIDQGIYYNESEVAQIGKNLFWVFHSTTQNVSNFEAVLYNFFKHETLISEE